MSGQRQFDTDAALDAAMRVFWRLGYEATTVHDLTAATRLGRGSLYGAFGNKEGLFLAVIDHYLERYRHRYIRALSEPDIEASVRAALHVVVDILDSDASQPGCLLVSAVENSEERAQRVHKRIRRAFADEERAFYDRFRRAQADGQISVAADPQALARFFAAQSRALALNARLNAHRAELLDILETSMLVLAPFLVASPADEMV